MNRLRILLVDDDGNIGALIAELLAEMGHDVCGFAATEQEAVTAAEQLTPDLMIVDMHLRAGSGLSAMATIRRRSPIPYIFMTGGVRPGIPGDAVLLQKPFGTLGLAAALLKVAPQVTPAT